MFTFSTLSASLDEASNARYTKLWTDLQQHAQRLNKVSPQDWLSLRQQESPALWSHRFGDLLLDISRQQLDQAVWQDLIALAQASPLQAWREGMFAGARLNASEQRAVTHWRWRQPKGNRSDTGSSHQASCLSPGEEVLATRDRLDTWVADLHAGRWRLPNGEQPRAMLCLGIGGSYLGPLLVCDALRYSEQSALASTPSLPAHFVANVDAHELERVLAGLDPHRTLVTIASKTFTTRETMRNADSVREWLLAAGVAEPAKHCIALTSATALAAAWGIPEQQQFGFDEGVGGRFSVWSPVGLPARLAIGETAWQALLDGAAAMDAHFLEASFADNLPVILALLDLWNHSVKRLPARTIAPYDARLRYWVGHLQQLEMESLGKAIGLDGQPPQHAACPMLWGEPGTNGQHAYFQWLHQGLQSIAVELMLVAQADHHFAEHADILFANGLAQANALAYGVHVNDAMRDLPGGKPLTLWCLPRLDAYHLGAMLACMEHKVVCLGALWQINPFDQFGVELGKRMAQGLEACLAAPASEHALAGAVENQQVLAWRAGLQARS